MSKVKSYYGGSTSHYYTYNGSTLVQEKIVTSGSQTTEYLTFLYNSEGPTGFVYNNTVYTYRKNIFGDIIAVYNGTSKVAEYAYDAYGNCRVITGSNIGTLNPFRYRGYYFDEDMKLYYLQSRYYDPQTGRFINADDVSYLDPETIHGLNLYAYCLNNPVMYSDPSGLFVLTTFGIGAIVALVSASIIIGGGIQLASNALAGETGSDLWRGVAGAALGAGANALALCLVPFTGGASLAISALIGAYVQTTVDTVETLIRGEDVSLLMTILDFRVNFATTFVGNVVGAKIIPTNAGWFKPQKFISVFTKPYGQKLLLQTALGTLLSGIVNFIRKFYRNSVK